jgi:hypothetical protein
LGSNIPLEAECKAGKEVQIQLTKAVALENKHGSITAAQKAGRAIKTKTTRIGFGDESGSGSGSELVNALVTASNTVSAAANILESSAPIRRPNQTPLNQVDVQNSTPPRKLRRQLFTKSQFSPIRQPQSQVSPDLLAPEPVKKTQKQRALVEELGEVDMGPRKLQSRK